MKISCINNNNINFNARYKTEDLLRLVTNYPYKNKDTDKIIKSLTGIDMYSDEFRKSVASDETYAIVTFALGDICADKVMQQEPRLIEARDNYTANIATNFDRNIKDNWFESQLLKLGKSINILPFSVTQEEIKKRYQEWIDMINYFQDELLKMRNEKK